MALTLASPHAVVEKAASGVRPGQQFDAHERSEYNYFLLMGA